MQVTTNQWSKIFLPLHVFHSTTNHHTYIFIRWKSKVFFLKFFAQFTWPWKWKSFRNSTHVPYIRFNHFLTPLKFCVNRYRNIFSSSKINLLNSHFDILTEVFQLMAEYFHRTVRKVTRLHSNSNFGSNYHLLLPALELI